MTRITIAAAAALLTLNTAAQAATWQPTNADINTFDLSLTGAGAFGIFDAGGLADGFSLSGPDLALATIDTVSFSQLPDLTWEISNLAGDVFNLGDDNRFQIGYSLGGMIWFEELVSFELAAPGSNIWLLGWVPGVALTAVDIELVPLPPAVLLFASSMLGMLLVGRHRGAAV